MLYLKLTADDAAGPAPRVLPLAETTVELLERALLTSNSDERFQILSQAIGSDDQFRHWSLLTAECGLNRTVNDRNDAIHWLTENLRRAITTSFVQNDELQPTPAEWRLLRLVDLLRSHERQVSDFNQRLEREKLDSLKELAYGASHEINNPLANIAARAQTLLDGETDPERSRKLIAIHRQAMRAHEMISDLMLFARPPKLNKRQSDLVPLVQQSVENRQELAKERDIELKVDIQCDALPANFDETQLSAALDALIKNSLEAVRDGGQVIVSVAASELNNSPAAEIRVTDNGPGISADIRRHIFDPFFSGREAGRGLGFGLSKCWRIVTDHGGEVRIGELATGAQIIIRLPLE